MLFTYLDVLLAAIALVFLALFLWARFRPRPRRRYNAIRAVPVVRIIGSPNPVTLDLWDTLTKREQEIAFLAAKGDSTKQIARKLNITTDTVQSHIKHLYPKLGINNRQQLTHVLRGIVDLYSGDETDSNSR